jgi:MerR family transcriptional regulator, light-induced transcriptional regulator
MTADVLTLQEAASRLKVHYMTAYRWVRSGELPAYKVGGRLRIRGQDLELFMRGRALDVALPSAERGRTAWSTHRRRLHALLRDGAASEAAALLRKVVADGASVGDVYVELIAPALHRIGEDWAAGHITVAEEHRASEVAKALVARLGEAFRRHGPARGTVATLTPPGEQHGLASTMVADVLRGSGFDVHHLGADVPVQELALFLQVVPCDALCISVTRTDLDPLLLGQLVATATRAGVGVVVGGQCVDAAGAAAAGAAHAPDLERLAQVVGALLDRR